MRIKLVCAFTNGNVMVFGMDGQQIAALQGRWAECYGRILALCDAGTEIHTGVAWSHGGLYCTGGEKSVNYQPAFPQH